MGRILYVERIFYLGSILQHLIHGFPLSGPESGHTEQRSPRQRRRLSRPFSFIRTLTVGFGITPNLLTPARRFEALRFKTPIKALAGLGLCDLYRRWGIAPRPENIGRPELGDRTKYAPGIAPAASGLAVGNLHVPHDSRRPSPPRPAPEPSTPGRLIRHAKQKVKRASHRAGHSDSVLFCRKPGSKNYKALPKAS
jgi:hypothetical protein